eukprot:CAMPEP_0194042814 /NCGR_PEP_ID=MMETSP0009_2-20130614/14554_1 /TAXON_ID=210454 /ORGANISM="Grammatophora oceanica, Strain CCMP 410" /LENGTH=250 /DNA_ID=CAMNT_0038686809 /DNA_START=62 /DNA_END=814 /DNA_ORIENTATION=+
MTQQADDELLQLWKDEWSKAGWEPRLIGIEEAMRHPQYAQYNSILDGLPNLKVYDRYCFLRWLAMSVVGGGWMSDYDTFPLHPTLMTDGSSLLPNSGMLTVHEHSKFGGVPDLVSGSAVEFDRVGKALIDNCRLHYQDSFWSDMFAMHDVYVDTVENGRPIYIMSKNVVPGQVVMRQKGISERTCRRTHSKYAIHFSHYAIEFGETASFGVDGTSPEHRPLVAREWLRQWRAECLGKDESGYINGRALAS